MSEIFDRMPVEIRDEMVADVMAFLVERGYTITAPGKSLYDHTDWKALKEQKRWLLEMIQASGEYAMPSGPHIAEGLVNYLDHLQDEAEARGYPVEWLTEGEE